VTPLCRDINGTTFTVYVTACQVEKLVLIKQLKIQITCAFSFIHKHIIANACYIFGGMWVRKVSNSKCDLSRLVKVIDNGAIRYATYNFLLVLSSIATMSLLMWVERG